MSHDEQTLQVSVTHKAQIAEDIFLFEMRDPSGMPLPAFTAGAHIGVTTRNGCSRKYSLCNDPLEQERYLIAVKKELNGRGGSVNFVETTSEGDLISITPPRNDFALKGNSSSYLFIAGGIGITPIRAMIKQVIAEAKPFKLYYFTRSSQMMAFREEFMGQEFRGKAIVHHDGGNPDNAFDLWPVLEDAKGAHLYCCGPRGLMEAVRDMTGHWSSAAVHFEDFGAARSSSEQNTPFAIKLAREGVTLQVPSDKSILETLRDSGHKVPSSCESGTCGTCRTKLIAGEADHRDLVLSEHERGKSIIICVSRAKSPELVLDL
jgi:phthalate 4,5-dioxygenase reductase component